MATEIWSEADDLMHDIESNGKKFNFFQLMTLLEQEFPQVNIQLNPSASLAFPARDIVSCIKDIKTKSTLTIELSFMGLCGVDTPLPHYFLQWFKKDSNGEVFKSFLNIFNQRIYQLCYQLWKNKHSAAIRNQDYYNSKLFNNGSNFILFFKKMLPNMDISVKQFVPNWILLATKAWLGTSLYVGNNVVLGESVLDISSRIEITIGTFSLATLLTFLPGRQEGIRLAKLLRYFLPPQINFSLYFIVSAKKDAAFTLGQEDMLLGLHSWLGKQSVRDYCLHYADINYLF